MIRVLVVDDHPVVREGLIASLQLEPDIQVVGEAESSDKAMQVLGRLNPDVVLVDVRLGRTNGIDLCAEIVRRYPGIRVVALTTFPTEGTIMSAFSAGARGFVVKESTSAAFRQAVRAVAAGETFVDSRVGAKLVALATKGRRTRGPHGLTLQEMRVLELLPGGLTNRQIARELRISEHTVKSHLANAMRKIGAKHRSEAAAISQREGLA